MNKNLFWLDDLQWASVEPYIPSRKQRGPRRVIISGIIHVMQSGCRWRDCPSEYGPATTVYNRFLRWSKKGVWEKMFLELSGIAGTHHENSIDSTAIKAHRAAHGKKGGKHSVSAGLKSTRLRIAKADR